MNRFERAATIGAVNPKGWTHHYASNYLDASLDAWVKSVHNANSRIAIVGDVDASDVLRWFSPPDAAITARAVGNRVIVSNGSYIWIVDHVDKLRGLQIHRLIIMDE